MMLLTSSLLHCGVCKYLQLYIPLQILVYPLYNLCRLGKANHFRLTDESNEFVLGLFCLKFTSFCWLFFFNATTAVQCEEAFLIIFLVRHKLMSGFLKLVLQHQNMVANAFGTVKTHWSGAIFAMAPAGAVGKAEAVSHSWPVPFLLLAPPGRFSLPGLCLTLSGGAGSAGRGRRQQRCAQGWGRGRLSGHLRTSQYTPCFSR